MQSYQLKLKCERCTLQKGYDKTHEVYASMLNSGSNVKPNEKNKTIDEEADMVKKGTPVSTRTRLDFSEYSKNEFEKIEGVAYNDFTLVTHEMQHQYDFDQGTNTDDQPNSEKDPSEIRAVNNENRARKIDNMDKRTTYGGDQIDPEKLE